MIVFAFENNSFSFPIQSIGNATGFFALGTTAFFIHSSLATPLFAMSGGVLAAGIAIKAITSYDKFTANQILIAEKDFHKKYSYIIKVTLVFILVFSSIATTICCGLALILGLYTGIRIEFDDIKREQKTDTKSIYKELR